jgi:hypothetical protein
MTLRALDRVECDEKLSESFSQGLSVGHAPRGAIVRPTGQRPARGMRGDSFGVQGHSTAAVANFGVGVGSKALPLVRVLCHSE